MLGVYVELSFRSASFLVRKAELRVSTFAGYFSINRFVTNVARDYTFSALIYTCRERYMVLLPLLWNSAPQPTECVVMCSRREGNDENFSTISPPKKYTITASVIHQAVRYLLSIRYSSDTMR